MNNKAPKKLSWIDVALAVPGMLCGCLVAIGYLLLKPVDTVGAPPSASDRASGQVYFIQGSHDRAKGASWTQKRHALLTAAPGEITLSEDELNAWFAASTHIRQARKSAGARNETIEVGQPDFRIAGGLLQVAAPATLHLFSANTPLIVQMRGDFARANTASAIGATGMIMYSPKEVFAGSLPLHRIPGATSYLFRTLLENQTMPGEAVSACRKISRVSIVGRELRITMTAGTE